MPSRKIQFITDEYYHVYNRGVDKRMIFSDAGDYSRFLTAMSDFNSSMLREERLFRSRTPKLEFDSAPLFANELVEIVCYCLNPNHFHLIIKQKQDGGIVSFMQKIGTGYTNYFNIKQKRSGALFQGKFKAIHIDSNAYLLYLSAYVNLNYFIHMQSEKNSVSWPYSSFAGYARAGVSEYDGNVILSQFANTDDYRRFVESNACYMKEKKNLQKYLLEE